MKTILYLFLFAFGMWSITACTESKDTSTSEPEVTEATDMQSDVSVSEEATAPVIIEEHHFNDIPTTSHGSKKVAHSKAKAETSKMADGAKTEETKEVATKAEEAMEPLPEPTDYEVHTVSTLNTHMVEAGYEKNEEVDVAVAIVPLDETETIIAYNKKDEQTGVLQVVSDADGNIQKIFFADKHHKDVYDVANGMTAKEVKQLRKQMKHVEHKSNHYLYDDQSNIMYLLDAIDEDGNEYVAADVDKMEVRAIVWTDKKNQKEMSKAVE